MSKTLNIVLWVLQVLLAGMFFMASWPKLTGNPQAIAGFDVIGLGQWFRIFTGALEVVGAILLLIPRMAFFGASIIIVVMIGAIATHLFIIGGSPLGAVICLLVAAVIAWGRRGQLQALFT
jgi:putative oxidoreductase